MYEKLEQLARLNEEMNTVIGEVKKCNEGLAAEYMKRENEALKHLMSEVHKIAEFGKQIVKPYNAGYGTGFDTGIDMNWYKGSYGKGTDLSFSIDSDGNFEFTTYPSGYSSRQTVYSSKEDKWDWYENECKKFIATHANEILFSVQEKVEKKFEETMVRRMEQVQTEQRELLVDIGKVSDDKDLNLDAKLKDAIQRAGIKQDDKPKPVHKETVIE